MTVPELVASILPQLEHLYQDLPRRDWARDRQYLIAAVGTYGWECSRRNWQFDAQFIYQELCRLILSFKRRANSQDIRWLPNYLQTAIKQHIREHAEELKVQATQYNAPRSVRKITEGLNVIKAVVEPTDAELLGKLHKDVLKLRRQSATASRLRTSEQKKQGQLL